MYNQRVFINPHPHLKKEGYIAFTFVYRCPTTFATKTPERFVLEVSELVDR